MAVPEGVVQSHYRHSACCEPTVARRPDCRTRRLVPESPPPGDPLLIHVDKVDIPDGPPSNGELRDVVQGLRNGRAMGASGLQAEHIKVWLSNVMRKEEEKESDVGLGDKWCIFDRLMQAIWEQGCMPQQMKWEIIVLLLKGGSDYCGIGLLDPFWKVVEKIMVA